MKVYQVSARKCLASSPGDMKDNSADGNWVDGDGYTNIYDGDF